MPDPFDNPMGLDGFEFVEFASPTPGVIEPMLEALGFTMVARHRSKSVQLWRQGDINFIVNDEPGSVSAYFAAEHGPTAFAMETAERQREYQRCWQGLKKHFNPERA